MTLYSSAFLSKISATGSNPLNKLRRTGVFNDGSSLLIRSTHPVARCRLTCFCILALPPCICGAGLAAHDDDPCLCHALSALLSRHEVATSERWVPITRMHSDDHVNRARSSLDRGGYCCCFAGHRTINSDHKLIGRVCMCAAGGQRPRRAVEGEPSAVDNFISQIHRSSLVFLSFNLLIRPWDH